MHNSLRGSNSLKQNSGSQRSTSTSFQRTTTSHRTEYTLEYMNTSMEEMDWSDTSLDVSNNSFLSPATFRGQSNHPSGSWKNKDNTSPSSLLSSLNIADFPRPRTAASPETLPNFETSSAHHSMFRPSQSMSKLSASNLSLAKPKLPSVVTDLSSPSSRSLKSPFTASKLVSKMQPSSMSLPAFHRTLPHSFQFPKNSRTFDHDTTLSDSHHDRVTDALGDESVMESKDESVQGNKIAAGTDAEAKEGNNLQSAELKKQKRSGCSCFYRVSCYSLLAVLAVFSAMLMPHSYFQFRVCDTTINVSLVHRALSSNVFGQHLAVQVVSERLGQFLNDSRTNLLVLSFQGWTGIGKNHMSNILARFVQPRNVHRYIVTLHFAGNSELDMQNWIESEVTASCGLHLFVVDEMDKASDVLVSGLRKALHSAKEFLSDQPNTKAIVLLLSNTGSIAINTYTAQVLDEGVLRENIAFDGFMEKLETVHQRTWYSKMLKEKLIDQIVPFLPLEKTHVEKCAVAALGSRQVEVKDEIISAVLNRLSYFPLSNSMFSTTGCRKVNAELDLVLY